MRKTGLRRAFLLSLALHIVLAAALVVFQAKTPRPQPEIVTIDFNPAPERVAAREEAPKQQIVEQDEKSLNDEKPLKDAFLSARDQRVKKQTIARERGDFRNSREKQTQQKAARPKLQDLMGTSAEALLKRHEDAQRNAEQAANRAAEASRSNDYLKNVEAGNETMLNTREFKYYTYYSRIRRQLSQYWEPTVREKLTKMFKQGRRIASEQDHITKLLIVLSHQGTLVKVQVVSESGVSDLDDAATEAFRSAAPFPNPPKGIVEEDGTVKIRWDFVLES